MANPSGKNGDSEPNYFGIHKVAISAWVALSEGLNDIQYYPCRDNSYYYTDYDGRGLEPEDDYWLRKALSEDDCESLCTDCPVIKLCYDFAVANGEKHGVWGGINFGPEDHKKNGRLF